MATSCKSMRPPLRGRPSKRAIDIDRPGRPDETERLRAEKLLTIASCSKALCFGLYPFQCAEYQPGCYGTRMTGARRCSVDVATAYEAVAGITPHVYVCMATDGAEVMMRG